MELPPAQDLNHTLACCISTGCATHHINRSAAASVLSLSIIVSRCLEKSLVPLLGLCIPWEILWVVYAIKIGFTFEKYLNHRANDEM